MGAFAADLELIVRAARAGAAVLTEAFRERGALTVREKKPADFVSGADLASEAAIRAVLAAGRPDIPVMGEEGGGAADARGRFIVDPLDGTTNYLHGVPHASVSIALEHEGEIVAGAVLDFARGECFSAERGEGCWLDGARISVSKTASVDEAIIATGIPHRGRGDHPRYLRALSRVMERASGIRRFGSAALDLSYVAAGRFDGFFERGLSRWDIAAGMLLVREAGGELSEPSGGGGALDSGDVLASNGRLHAELSRLVGEC